MTTISNLYAPIGLPQSYKILQVIPRNAAESDANKRALRPMLVDQQMLHMFKQMESKISWLQIAAVFGIFFLGTVVVQFFGSAYFQFGKPVLVKDVLLDTNVTYWFNIIFIAWDRVFAFITSYYIGKWRIGVLFGRDIEVKDQPSYSKGMFVILTNHVMTWLRYPVMVVFIYSQIDFGLAYAIPDMLLNIFAAHLSVTTMIEVCENNKARKSAKEKTEIEKVLPSAREIDKWKWRVAGINIDVVLVITFCEYLQLVAYIMMFYGTGILQSNYFQFHPPFDVFGRHFKQKGKYAFIIIFVFIDQILASLLNVIVGPYINNNLLNSSPRFTDTRYGKNGARFIYNSRKVFQWIRTMFVLNFTLSQFIFFFFIIVADTIITIWLTDKALAMRGAEYAIAHPDQPNPEKTTNRMLRYARELQISPMGIVIVVWIEMIIVILVMIFQFDIHERLTYFDFPPPLVIFDVVIHSGAVIAMVLVYACLDRVVFTLTTEITFPYISNVISACDDTVDYAYNYYDLMFIMVSNDLTGWVRRIVGFNFLLSNISLVIAEGGTDIVVSWIILERYLKHKELVNAEKYLEWRQSTKIEMDKQQKQKQKVDYIEMVEEIPVIPAQEEAETNTGSAVKNLFINRVSGRMSQQEREAILAVNYACDDTHISNN